jgi:hypothetical protein
MNRSLLRTRLKILLVLLAAAFAFVSNADAAQKRPVRHARHRASHSSSTTSSVKKSAPSRTRRTGTKRTIHRTSRRASAQKPTTKPR